MRYVYRNRHMSTWLSKHRIDHIKINMKRIAILMLLSTSLIPCLTQYIINYSQSMPSDLVKKLCILRIPITLLPNNLTYTVDKRSNN